MTGTVTHRTLVVDYVDWMRGKGLSDKTIAVRLTFAQHRLSDWGHFTQRPADVAAWLSGYQGWTRRTYQNHLKSLYAFLIDAEWVDVDPIAAIRQAPTPQPQPKPLSQSELDLLLNTAPDRDMRAILLLASKAGLRLHEIAKVRGEDITSHGLVVLGKGHKMARVPVHPEIAAIAQDYPATGYWFPSPQHRFAGQPVTSRCIAQRVLAHFRAQRVPGGIHRARATYGTTLARRGVPIHVVQSLMRHASLQTTQSYLGVDEDERAAAIGVL